MFKRIVALVIFALLSLAQSNVSAATYDSGKYGECRYSEGCAAPVVIPPESPPPAPDDPLSVSRDVDSDGNAETATDSNNIADDGYETFADADGSSSLLKSLDGDGDGKVDFIISTDEDSFPERYWDPDNDLLSTIQLVECDEDNTLEWRFETGTETRTYDPNTNAFLSSCESPSQPNANPGSTGSSGRRGSGSDNRITGILPLISDSPVYQAVGEVIKKVPEPVAYSFPYVLLFLLLLLALRLIWQSKHEVNRLIVASETLETEKRLSLEKENFMRLSSHYLRTPITVMRGNIELMQSLKQISEEVAKTLSAAGQLLMDHVSSLLEHLEDNKLVDIKPAQQQVSLRSILSPFVVLPVSSIIGLIFIGHLLFIDFRVTSPNLVDILAQIILAVLAVQLIISKLRQRHLNRTNRMDQERVLNEQRVLDTARSQFINNVANSLEQQLIQFSAQLGELANKPEAAKVNSALKELSSMVSKFRLVAYLQGHEVEASRTNFGLRELVDEALQPYNKPAQLRGIVLDENIEEGQLYQQRQLMGIVLRSLIDNALKFSTDGTAIEVGAKNERGRAVFTVTDNGQGIPKDKQDLLFKPFSRTDSAETFNSEGLGFSLYLDKVIAHYLKGDIAVESDEGKGTVVTVSVPASL